MWEWASRERVADVGVVTSFDGQDGSGSSDILLVGNESGSSKIGANTYTL